LPIRDYAIFGSGPLAIRGVIPLCNDLDILCRRGAWELVSQIGKTEYLPAYDVTIVSLFGGSVTFGTQWGIGNFDVDDLIDSAVIIDSLPFVQIKHVIAYKKLRSSAKDLLHINALETSGYHLLRAGDD